MPALDRDHVAVRNALVKDGWTITHDPLRLNYKKKRLYVDLEQATGQYMVYRSLLRRSDPERTLVLAVSQETLETVFEEEIVEWLP